MDQSHLARAALTLSVDADTAVVATALARAGVEVVLLKGPVIARLLQPGGPFRTYGDIDIMVAPADHRAAEQTLAALSYKRGMRALPATTWRHPTRVRRPVDLHESLHLVRADPDTVWRVIRRTAVPIEVAGVSLLAPGVPVVALHLALHAAADGRPRILGELEQAATSLPLSTWIEARAVAAELGALEALGGGLSLCPAGSRVAAQLGLSTEGSTEMRLGRATTSWARPLTIELVMAQPSFVAAVRTVVRRCFPPPRYIRPLGGRRGRLWLGLGYLVRLSAIVARIPSSLVAWARVRFARVGDPAPPTNE